MRKSLALSFALSLAGCATISDREVGVGRPNSSWLVGSWLLLEPGEERDLSRCASGLPITYLRDGSYSLFEEVGTWHLHGDRLTETAMAATEAGNPAEVAIGQPFTSRIRRIGPGEMEKTFAGGERLTLLRCPPLQ